MKFLTGIAIALLLWVALTITMVRLARGDEIDDLIPHIIQVESNGNPNAVSPAGAIGLMQITPIVLDEWVENFPPRTYNGTEIPYKCFCRMEFYKKSLKVPRFNKDVGEWYLRRLKNHYLKDNYTIERMLASYNGGITRLRRNGYDISKMPKETREYVRKVMTIYNKEDN